MRHKILSVVTWRRFREHDKDPETFFRVLFELHGENLNFHLSVLGESYTEPPGNGLVRI